MASGLWKSTSASGARARLLGDDAGISPTARHRARRRVDGVEDGAAIQHERAVNLISTQVPEGSGWRGALAAFLGDATTADFYAQVEATIVSDGVVATTDELLAAISGTLSDAAVAAAAQTQTDFTTCEWSTAARNGLQRGPGLRRRRHGATVADPGGVGSRHGRHGPGSRSAPRRPPPVRSSSEHRPPHSAKTILLGAKPALFADRHQDVTQQTPRQSRR